MLARDGAMRSRRRILRDYADETAAAPADDATAPARTARRSSRCSARCAVASTSRRRQRRSSARAAPPRAPRARRRLPPRRPGHAALRRRRRAAVAAEFWRQLNELPPSLHPNGDELIAAATPGRYGGAPRRRTASAAAMAVDGRAGEILARIDAIVRADGAALAAMMPRPPGSAPSERPQAEALGPDLDDGRHRPRRGARRAS